MATNLRSSPVLLLLLLYSSSLYWTAPAHAHALVSNKRVRENGIKEFTVEKDIHGNGCACNCLCAPNADRDKSELPVSLPSAPDVSQLNQMVSGDSSNTKYFKIVKEIRKNKCSCSCMCTPQVLPATTTIPTSTPTSTSIPQEDLLPSVTYTAPSTTMPSIPQLITTTRNESDREITEGKLAGEILNSEVTRSVITNNSDYAVTATTLLTTTDSFNSTSSPTVQLSDHTTPNSSSDMASPVSQSTPQASLPESNTSTTLDPAYKAKVANLLNMLKEQLFKLRTQNHSIETSFVFTTPTTPSTTTMLAPVSSSESTSNVPSTTSPSLAQRAEILLNTLRMKLDALKKMQQASSSSTSASLAVQSTTAELPTTGVTTSVAEAFSATHAVGTSIEPTTITATHSLINEPTASVDSTTSQIQPTATTTTIASITTKSIVDRMLEDFRESKETSKTEKEKPTGEDAPVTTPTTTHETKSSATNTLTTKVAEAVEEALLSSSTVVSEGGRDDSRATSVIEPATTPTTPPSATTTTLQQSALPGITTSTITKQSSTTTEKEEDGVAAGVAFVTEAPETTTPILTTTTAIGSTSEPTIVLRVGPNSLMSSSKLAVKQSSSVGAPTAVGLQHTHSTLPTLVEVEEQQQQSTPIITTTTTHGPPLQFSIDEHPALVGSKEVEAPVHILLTRPSFGHTDDASEAKSTVTAASPALNHLLDGRQSSTITASDVLEQARELREEQRQLDAENSILKETSTDDTSAAQIQQRKRVIEQKLAQLAQLERWHRELLQRRQSHRNAGAMFPHLLLTTTGRSEEATSVVQECGLVKNFVDAFHIDDSAKWVEDNCEKIRHHFPAASCAYVQNAFNRCFNQSA